MIVEVVIVVLLIAQVASIYVMHRQHKVIVGLLNPRTEELNMRHIGDMTPPPTEAWRNNVL